MQINNIHRQKMLIKGTCGTMARSNPRKAQHLKKVTTENSEQKTDTANSDQIVHSILRKHKRILIGIGEYQSPTDACDWPPNNRRGLP